MRFIDNKLVFLVQLIAPLIILLVSFYYLSESDLEAALIMFSIGVMILLLKDFTLCAIAFVKKSTIKYYYLRMAAVWAALMIWSVISRMF
jgi:hypothetical protein